MAQPLDQVIPEPAGTGLPQHDPPLGWGGMLENLSIGVGEGLRNQLIGMQQMVTHPVQTLVAIGGMAKAGWEFGQKPTKEALPIIANAISRKWDESTSGPLAIGRVFGENLSPRAVFGGRIAPMREIVSPDVAKSLNVADQLPVDDLFRQAVANTPGAEITSEGLRLRVARRQLAEMDDADSVRTGVFYLPESDKRMSYYTGKNGYGGDVKHMGETLLRRPLFVKGATGGKAPEAAYDQLLGKGAYEKMRTDVLNAIGFGSSEVPNRIAEVMDKYGADPDLAWYIVENSKKGNTLAYAVQENIVAHAVRAAGFDGVVGHTKTKAGPVISELFDVREVTYPSQFNKPTIHEKFRK